MTNCTLLERASGVKLHRSVGSGKVKFLPISKWKSLKKEDIPYYFIQLSEDCGLDFPSNKVSQKPGCRTPKYWRTK